MKTNYLTYKGQPTNPVLILTYLQNTPFKQMAIKRIAADLNMDRDVCVNAVCRLVESGKVTREMSGRMSIVVLAKKE